MQSNPLEVLKVRMQTAIPAAAVADTPSTSRVGAGSRPPNGTRAGLVFLWKTEGVRFLVAGAAAPILVSSSRQPVVASTSPPLWYSEADETCATPSATHAALHLFSGPGLHRLGILCALRTDNVGGAAEC